MAAVMPFTPLPKFGRFPLGFTRHKIEYTIQASVGMVRFAFMPAFGLDSRASRGEFVDPGLKNRAI
jgi:hypothetical protein